MREKAWSTKDKKCLQLDLKNLQIRGQKAKKVYSGKFPTPNCWIRAASESRRKRGKHSYTGGKNLLGPSKQVKLYNCVSKI